jgi:hypothetical protein
MPVRVVTGLVLVRVLHLAPSRLVSMTLGRAPPEAEEASRYLLAACHLLASRQQSRLHAWRRMAGEKKKVKREISKKSARRW